MGPCSFISTGAVMFATFEAVDSAFFRDQLKKEFAPLEREVFKVRKPNVKARIYQSRKNDSFAF
jgi:hypothetical protein